MFHNESQTALLGERLKAISPSPFITLLLLLYSQKVTVAVADAFNSLGLGDIGRMIFKNVNFAIARDDLLLVPSGIVSV